MGATTRAHASTNYLRKKEHITTVKFYPHKNFPLYGMFAVEFSNKACSVLMFWFISLHDIVFSTICYSLQGVSTMCDYDQPLNNFEDISTTVLYNTVDGVTATLAITIEETVTLLYVGYTNGAEHFLAAVSTSVDTFYGYSNMPTYVFVSVTTATCSRY